MKKSILFLAIFIIIYIKALSQDYQNIDNKVDKYPRSFSKPEKLAELINKDFKSENDKARAIYRWIALNIAYDVKAFYQGQKVVTYSYSTPEEKEKKEKEYLQGMVAEVLKKKKAVCEGYSTLFKTLCDLTKVECVVIQGFSKVFEDDIAKTPKVSDHSWNAVKIDNKWKLIDVTWGAGSVDYSKKIFVPKFTDVYFFTEPELFFLKHFPENKDWLFVNKSLQNFVEQPLYYSDISLGDITTIKPDKGIIKVKPKEKIEFKWKTKLNPKEISYDFRGDKYGKEISADSKNGNLSFEVTVEKVPGFLTFYYKGVAAISYRIEKK
jgi:hypothetical protein